MSKSRIIEAGWTHAQTESVQELRDLFGPWVRLPQEFGGAGAYRRLFPADTTFWLFLMQVLSPDMSCREVLRRFLAWLAAVRDKCASPSTSAYCQARMRLREEDIAGVHRQVAQNVEAQARTHDLWCGRPVKIVDGSSISMPDTPANQERYPQPKSQKKGCGFPVMRIVAIFSMSTGVLLELARDSLGVAERNLFQRLWDTFAPGDISLCDRGFVGYADFHLLKERGVDSVSRNHQCRVHVHVLKQLGKNDRLVQWPKMARRHRPKWMSQEEWEKMPDTLLVRLLTVVLDIPGFRSKSLEIATTLLDHKAYPAADIVELYRRRWAIEVYLRHMKTAMKMEVLRCKTPQMVDKELWMHVIAYNLIRAIMLDAATRYTKSLQQLSFKGTVDTLRHWAPMLALAHDPEERARIYNRMLTCIAEDRVPHRPGRSEPRAKKRRPKNFPLLNQTRNTYKEIPHRNRYRKDKS